MALIYREVIQIKTGRDYNAQFQTRSENDKRYIEGYFVRFDDRYQLWGGNYETISPNAFDNTLNRDILSLWNHDSNYPLGRTTNGTLLLRVDNVGVFGTVEINPNDTFAMDAYARIQRGDVKQCSFGFDILEESITSHDDGVIEFRIEEVELWEVSPVTFPAYEQTSISARKSDLDAMKKRTRQARIEQMKVRFNKIVKNSKTD